MHAGDKDLNKIERLIFPIIKILRNESNGTYEYTYDNSLVVIKNNNEEFRIPISEFHKQALSLLQFLINTTGTTFSFPETEKFINSFNCRSLKANSSVKSDIQVVIHDFRIGIISKLGFSIKSQLGKSSTLLNAGKTTNFIYKVLGISLSNEIISNINIINTKSKIRDRIGKIEKQKGVLSFLKIENTTFNNNLVLIDSSLPIILSKIVYLYYTSDFSKIIDLVNEITKLNPLKYDLTLNHPFYSYKIKRFLSDIALGMMPSQVWIGELDTTGGYLIVKEDGEILCYHIYNRNEFEDYLLNNTKLETASSTRHGFGTIYKEDLDLFFNLNLQIRFIK